MKELSQLEENDKFLYIDNKTKKYYLGKIIGFENNYVNVQWDDIFYDKYRPYDKIIDTLKVFKIERTEYASHKIENGKRIPIIVDEAGMEINNFDYSKWLFLEYKKIL